MPDSLIQVETDESSLFEVFTRQLAPEVHLEQMDRTALVKECLAYLRQYGVFVGTAEEDTEHYSRLGGP